MRLLLTSVTCPKGELAVNLVRHRELHAEATQAGCDLLLMPEMSLSGYLSAAAMALNDDAVGELVELTSAGAAISFGLVERPSHHGLPHISQVTASGGQIVCVHRKAGLGEDEAQYFVPGRPAEPFELGGVRISTAACAEIGTEQPYRQPSRLVLGPSAPGLYGPRRLDEEDWRRGFDWWRSRVVGDARRFLGVQQWLAVSTQAGATVDEDFPGWAALVGPGGQVLAALPDGHEATLVVEVPATEAMMSP